MVRAFDAAGRMVSMPLSGPTSAGRHDLVWDARRENGNTLPSGIYLVRVDSGGETATQKVTLLK